MTTAIAPGPTDPAAVDAPPLGEDPRLGGAALGLYRALRDARSSARAEERRQEAGSDGDEDGPAVTLQPSWAEVRDLARRISDQHAADVEVMAWLAEAETRIDGHAGLARAMGRIAAALRAHGAALHPQPEDAEDDTFAALAGLNGVGREGSLIQPLRLVPLAPGAPYGQASLWGASQPDGEEALRAELDGADRAAVAARLAEVARAGAMVREVDALLIALRGSQAPPFAQILGVLDDAERALRRLAGIAEAPPGEGGAEAEPAPEGAPAEAPRAPSGPPGAPRSREEAFEQLSRIAAYFRRTEPHSPMAQAIDTLVRRGRMDFAALLEELIPDESTRLAVLTSAGIKSPPEPSGGG